MLFCVCRYVCACKHCINACECVTLTLALWSCSIALLIFIQNLFFSHFLPFSGYKTAAAIPCHLMIYYCTTQLYFFTVWGKQRGIDERYFSYQNFARELQIINKCTHYCTTILFCSIQLTLVFRHTLKKKKHQM